ncbi:MAG: TAXI family TRAP transporter solute-binding subunit [Burkholderiales bacterium]|nr:TAXI family TRAP transporter solute-binding subunit [Burkholderiales bacterium]
MRPMQALAASCVAALLAAPAQAQVVSLITTPAGTFSNSAATAMAKVVSDKTRVRMTVQAQASSGYEELEAGSAEFTVSNSFDSTFFATGTGEYRDRGPSKVIRHVAAMTPYRVAMHVRADSPMKTLADLKGKRVSSEFNAQKTIGRIIAAHLANAGLSYKDVVGVPAPNVFRQAEDFKRGNVDVMFFALGAPQVKEAAAALGGLRVLEVDTAAEPLKRTQSFLPGAYIINVQPGPGTDGVTRPTHLVAFDMNLNSSVKVSEDVIYNVVKALHQNKQELVSVFPPFALFNPQQMAKPQIGIEFHPGAIRYYREAGMWPPGTVAGGARGEGKKK